MRTDPSAAGTVTAFAPATVANVSVGFDVLGFALAGVGDRITVTRDPAGNTVTVGSITGLVPDLPTDARRNTASVALLALLEDRRPGHGFKVSVHKGIPLGSGMGGSAASAVGAVVAANRLLERPLAREELLRYALAGEQVASGAAHADNAAPCLYGGLVAVVAADPLEVVSIPVPAGLLCVLVHPHLEVETRRARAVLRRELPLEQHVGQAMRLSGFLAGCFRGDLELIRRSMVDLVAEPSRAPLIPGFAEAKRAALGAGALGLGIAGSGPSLFAWTPAESIARQVEEAIQRTFAANGLESDSWIGPVGAEGATVVEGRG